MKKAGTLLLVFLSLVLCSFTDREEAIPFRIIASGSSHRIHFSCKGSFTLDSREEYDLFWEKIYGDLKEQPYFNMNDYRLIVIPDDYTVDEVTQTAYTVNVYATQAPAVSTSDFRPNAPPPVPTFSIIQIPVSATGEVQFLTRPYVGPDTTPILHYDAETSYNK